MKKNNLLGAVVFFMIPATVFANGSTAAFLKLGSGARAASLGGAYTAVSGDINAISYNPAGLSGLKRCEVGLTRAELIDGVNYSFLGYSKPVSKGVFGLGVNYLGQAAMESRGANREVTGKFEASDTAINMAYARALTARTGLGLNFKYITSRIAGVSANGWAVDAGWQYKMPVKGLTFGLAVQNFGPKMKFLDEGSALPLMTRAGAGYMFLENVFFSLDVSRQMNEKRTVFSFGSEYAVFNSLFMRAGYIGRTISGSSMADAGGVKAGFGVKLKRVNFDYSVTPFGDMGKAHRISCNVGF